MQIEDDSDAETYGEENEEQGNYSKRKIVCNWDRYQDTEKEVDNESGESQRGTDFSVLLSSAGMNPSSYYLVLWKLHGHLYSFLNSILITSIHCLDFKSR